jgi:hypothetical protein
MPGYVAKGLRDAAHILFVPLMRAECEMHILVCVMCHRQWVDSVCEKLIPSNNVC